MQIKNVRYWYILWRGETVFNDTYIDQGWRTTTCGPNLACHLLGAKNYFLRDGNKWKEEYFWMYENHVQFKFQWLPRFLGSQPHPTWSALATSPTSMNAALASTVSTAAAPVHWLTSELLSHHLPASPWPSQCWSLPPSLPSGVCANEAEPKKYPLPVTLFLLLLDFLHGHSSARTCGQICVLPASTCHPASSTRVETLSYFLLHS